MSYITKNGVIYGSTPDKYSKLSGLPAINGNTIEGNGTDNTNESLGISWHGTQEEYDAIVAAGTLKQDCIYYIDAGDTFNTGIIYNGLTGLPELEGHRITGSKTAADYGLMTETEIKNMIASSRSIMLVDALPPNPQAGTMYYVPNPLEGGYNVYIFDKNLNLIDLGSSEVDMSSYQSKVDPSLVTDTKTLPQAINEVAGNLAAEITTRETKNNEIIERFGIVNKIEVVEEEPTSYEDGVFYIVLEE